MILLYGAGGEPGRGEIPMDPIRYRASDVFLFCTWGFEEKLSAATKAQRQTDIERALRFGGSYKQDSNFTRKELKSVWKIAMAPRL